VDEAPHAAYGGHGPFDVAVGGRAPGDGEDDPCGVGGAGVADERRLVQGPLRAAEGGERPLGIRAEEGKTGPSEREQLEELRSLEGRVVRGSPQTRARRACQSYSSAFRLSQ